MRGNDGVAGSPFNCVDRGKASAAGSTAAGIRSVVNATLVAVSAEFDALFSPFGREPIPPRVATAVAIVACAPHDPLGTEVA